MQPAQADIIQKIRNGDEQAFKQLFLQYYASLCGYANKYVQDVDQSEEVVQDLFFNIWQKRERLEISTSLESYLFRAVRNACFNLLKHLKIRETYKAANQQAIKETEAAAVDTFVESELQESIEIAIEALPPERKKIFKMSRIDGMKYREIADELNLSVKTVEAQMGKALKYLRSCLSDYFIWLIAILIEIWNI